jgi:steroid delta-isomerase-like uncharacterized protein
MDQSGAMVTCTGGLPARTGASWHVRDRTLAAARAAGPVGADERGDSLPNHPETEELVKAYVRAIGSGDLEKVWECYADDIVYEDTAVNQVYYGKEAVKDFYVKSMGALGVRWIVDTCYATDEGFGIAWHMGGIHESDLPGMPATGKFFTVPGASIAQVKNGKIVRNRDYWNIFDLLRQLGLK